MSTAMSTVGKGFVIRYQIASLTKTPVTNKEKVNTPVRNRLYLKDIYLTKAGILRLSFLTLILVVDSYFHAR